MHPVFSRLFFVELTHGPSSSPTANGCKPSTSSTCSVNIVILISGSPVTEKTGLSYMILYYWRLALFGHVRRLPEDTPAHDVLQLSVCWNVHRHHIRPRLKEKARKTTKQLAERYSQGDACSSPRTRPGQQLMIVKGGKRYMVHCRLRVMNDDGHDGDDALLPIYTTSEQ